MRCLLLTLVLLTTGPVGAGPNESKILGEWQLIEFEGKPASTHMKKTRWRFETNHKFIWYGPGKKYEGTFHLLPNRKPRALRLDLSGEPHGGSARAAFRIIKNRLLIKLNDSGGQKVPRDFKPQNGHDLYLFERVKP